ncbi:hypothetical protein IZY60_05420 [Lutibacter sp. B2]|nr:hypothetical protein [Lutibacter sp. B2]
MFKYKKYPLKNELKYLYRPYRITLDTLDDYELIKVLYEKFYEDGYVNLENVMNHIDKNKEILEII